MHVHVGHIEMFWDGTEAFKYTEPSYDDTTWKNKMDDLCISVGI